MASEVTARRAPRGAARALREPRSRDAAVHLEPWRAHDRGVAARVGAARARAPGVGLHRRVARRPGGRAARLRPRRRRVLGLPVVVSALRRGRGGDQARRSAPAGRLRRTLGVPEHAGPEAVSLGARMHRRARHQRGRAHLPRDRGARRPQRGRARRDSRDRPAQGEGWRETRARAPRTARITTR